MRTTSALIALAVLLLACTAGPSASVQPSPSGVPSSTAPPSSPSTPPTPSPSTAPTPSPSPVPSAPSPDPGVAVVKIHQTGGMLPPWETLRWYPSVVLYADGRLIMQGPQIEIYPGPALPNLQVTHLTQRGIDQILAWAAEAGLTGPDRQLGPLILDSGSTVFTIVYADGTTHHTSITDMSGSDADIAAARQFQDIVLSARTWIAEDVIGDDEPYTFDRMRLISFPADPGSLPDPQLATELAWPLDEPLATLGDPISEPAQYRCAELSGEDLAQMLPLFQQSNELTLWNSDDELYQLYLHPLLPDEEGCPGL